MLRCRASGDCTPWFFPRVRNKMPFDRAPQHKFHALPHNQHKLTTADPISAMSAKFYFYFFWHLTPLADREG
jgi:hypothetical protein